MLTKLTLRLWQRCFYQQKNIFWRNSTAKTVKKKENNIINFSSPAVSKAFAVIQHGL